MFATPVQMAKHRVFAHSSGFQSQPKASTVGVYLAFGGDLIELAVPRQNFHIVFHIGFTLFHIVFTLLLVRLILLVYERTLMQLQQPA